MKISDQILFFFGQHVNRYHYARSSLVRSTRIDETEAIFFFASRPHGSAPINIILHENCVSPRKYLPIRQLRKSYTVIYYNIRLCTVCFVPCQYLRRSQRIYIYIHFFFANSSLNKRIPNDEFIEFRFRIFRENVPYSKLD